MEVRLPRAVRKLQARVVRVAFVDGLRLFGLQFARPLA